MKLSTSPPARATALVLAAIVAAAGCTTREPPPPVEAPAVPRAEPPPSPPSKPPVDWRRVNALLDRALDAMDRDHLLTPIDDAAYDYYRRVLEIVPDEPRALLGLERIVERYLELAEREIARGRWAEARRFVSRARVVAPDHPGADLVASRIELFANAKRERIALDAAAVHERTAEIREKLIAIGSRARSMNARVTITARDDAEGRWIYQQLNEGPSHERVMAQVEIGTEPAIQLTVFPSPPDGHSVIDPG